MDRREFLVAAAAAATARAAESRAPPPRSNPLRSPDAVAELSLADIAAAFADGRMTSQQLTQDYLTRIDELDRRGRAWVGHRNQSPRARNRRLTRYRAQDPGTAARCMACRC